MASELITSRNRLIAGLIILLVVFILICYFLITLFPLRKEPPKIGQHALVETFAYCDAEHHGLCVVSFSQDRDGGMQINIQTPYAYYPEIVVKIEHNGEESTYECQRVDPASPGMLCTGAPQVLGEVLQFKVISKNWGTLLAEGEFAIIGLALFTPEPVLTTTLQVTGTATVTPVFTTSTPPWTASPPSYPNPTSYP